jgi:hypothetical protein
MGQMKTGSTSPVCCTCQHWSGDRKLCENRMEILYMQSSRGRCHLETILSVTRDANDSCPKWQKWGAFVF